LKKAARSVAVAVAVKPIMDVGAWDKVTIGIKMDHYPFIFNFASRLQ
jgi:hypothetical protein